MSGPSAAAGWFALGLVALAVVLAAAAVLRDTRREARGREREQGGDES